MNTQNTMILASEQLIGAYLVERSRDTYSMPKYFDQFLDNVKAENKQPKEKIFVNSGRKQWRGFIPPANVHVFSY
jgi:hypothetical protein